MGIMRISGGKSSPTDGHPHTHNACSADSHSHSTPNHSSGSNINACSADSHSHSTPNHSSGSNCPSCRNIYAKTYYSSGSDRDPKAYFASHGNPNTTRISNTP